MTPDLEAIPLALAVVAIMLFSMRGFYGAWPWEKEKTWYALRPPPAKLDETFDPTKSPPFEIFESAGEKPEAVVVRNDADIEEIKKAVAKKTKDGLPNDNFEREEKA